MLSVFLAVSLYFCLVPSCLILSPETTLITQLDAEGKPDYAGTFRQENNKKLINPEDNGLRMVIEKFGPYVLEQTRLMQDSVWEDLPEDTTEKGKWYREKWMPLCKAMSIDHTKKPTEYKSIESKINATKKEEYQKTGFLSSLLNKSWRADDYPDIAKFVSEADEALSVYAVAVKKPQWVCYRPVDKGLMAVLLTDVHASRSLCADFAIRANERISRNDIVGAFDDVLSIFRIARHLTNDDSMIVARFTGFAIEATGVNAAQSILTYGKPNAEQIRQFMNEFNKIPKYNKSIDNITRFEKMMLLEILFSIKRFAALYDDDDDWGSTRFSDSYLAALVFRSLPALPIDYNIAAKRLLSNLESLDKVNKESDFDKRMQIDKQMDLDFFKLEESLKKPLLVLPRVPLIRQRSALLADYLTCLLAPALGSFYTAEARMETQEDMLRVSFALELYQRENGQYPDKLEAIVPKYIDVIPQDKFAAKELTYKKNDNGYILYSFGRNKIDDNGDAKQQKDIVIERKIYFRRS
jgi:hypothetical protein